MRHLNKQSLQPHMIRSVGKVKASPVVGTFLEQPDRNEAPSGFVHRYPWQGVLLNQAKRWRQLRHPRWKVPRLLRGTRP